MTQIFNRVLLALCLGVFSITVTAQTDTSIIRGKTLLFVIQLAATADVVEADQLAKEHFESLGFKVSVADHDEPASRAEDKDLVVISSSVSGHTQAGRYRYTKVPLITWEAHILDDLAMTGKTEDRDFGTDDRERHLWLVNAPHPLAGGLPAGTHNAYLRNAGMNWGKPGLGATIIATLPGHPDRAGVFAYEKGATMDYESIAPERRVFLFLDNSTFGLANDASLALIDAALEWSISKP